MTMRDEFIRFDDLECDVEQDDLIKGVMGEGEFAVIYGRSGVSKTFLALEMAHSIASGRSFLGHEVKQGSVLFIASEGFRSVLTRCLALRQEYGSDRGHPFGVYREPINLLDAERTVPMITSLSEAISSEKEPLKLVVFDTYAASIVGGDENSAKDSGLATYCLNQIMSEHGCSILLVGHTGKSSGTGIRGSYALTASADCLFEVQKTGGVDGAFEMQVTKQRDRALGAPIQYRLETVLVASPGRMEPVESCVVVSNSGLNSVSGGHSDYLVLDLLKEALGKSGEDVDGKENVPTGRIARADLREKFVLEARQRVESLAHSSEKSLKTIFNRTLKKLSEKGVLEVDNDWISFVESEADDIPF